MRVVLLNPTDGAVYMTPPLGLRYLSAVLKRAGIDDVHGVDLNVDPPSALAELLPGTDVLGITTPSRLLPQALECARQAKALNSSIRVVLGGPHPTLEPAASLAPDPIDFVVVGEGEHTFLELIQALRTDRNPDLAGLWRKRGADRVAGAPRPWLSDLDTLPFADLDLLPADKYVRWTSQRLVTLTASRSCPFRCTTCQPALGEIIGPYRQRSVAHVLAEIESAISAHGVRRFSFLDNTFNVHREWVQQFCEEVLRRGLRYRWSCSGVVRNVDRDLLRLMRSAGCEGFAYGIESGSQRVLDQVLRKKVDLQHAREVVRETTALGIKCHCFFMIGIPGETPEEMLQTLALAESMGADSIMITIVAPLPHIAINDLCQPIGRVLPHGPGDLERPGLFPFSRHADDEYLGRSSLYETDTWGPEFVEEVKERILATFVPPRWLRWGGVFVRTANE